MRACRKRSELLLRLRLLGHYFRNSAVCLIYFSITAPIIDLCTENIYSTRVRPGHHERIGNSTPVVSPIPGGACDGQWRGTFPVPPETPRRWRSNGNTSTPCAQIATIARSN